MQFAWLDYNEGAWILITNIPGYRERIWAAEDLAIKALKEEGWFILGPFSDAEAKIFYGYALGRAVN